MRGKAGEYIGGKINNYIEYQKRLKEFFSGIKEMPSSEEVQSFIDKYNLFIDWQIIILDVKKDISSLMLKNITGKSKSISSYKQYLVKLKESFGSLDEMPSRKQIEEFIEEYNLGKSWGIVEEDVVKDLEEIINGKYDDMLKDSAYVHDITVKKTVTKSSINPYSPSVNRGTQEITFQLNSSSNIDYGRLYGHTYNSYSVSVKLPNILKEEKRKGSNKVNKTKKIERNFNREENKQYLLMVIIILKKRKKASNIQQKIQRSELFFRKWEQNANLTGNIKIDLMYHQN